jgi:hypothetical protein
VDEAVTLAVTFVGRHEILAADFGAVSKRLDIATLELDGFNQSYQAAWPQLYTRKTLEIARWWRLMQSCSATLPTPRSMASLKPTNSLIYNDYID